MLQIIIYHLQQNQVIFNDISVDNNLKIIREYANDNRFIIINENYFSYDDSINEGIKFVSGEYIGIIELNYFIDINMFENLYKFTYNNNVDIVRYNYHLNKNIFFFSIQDYKIII